MAYAYRSSTVAGNNSGGALSINKPASVADGDLLVVNFYLESDTNTFSSVPTGWNTGPTYANTGIFKVHTFWKIAASEGASWSWTPTSNAWRSAVCAAYSGAQGTGATRVDVSGGAQADGVQIASQTAPSVTTTADGDLVCFQYGNYTGDNATGGSGFATNFRVSNGGTLITDAIKTTAGATGTTAPSGGNVGTEDYAALHVGYFLDTGGGGGTTQDAAGTSAGAGNATTKSSLAEYGQGTTAGAALASTRSSNVRSVAGTTAGAGLAQGTAGLVLPASGTAAGAADTDSAGAVVLSIAGTSAGAADTDSTGALVLGTAGATAGAGQASTNSSLVISVSGTSAGAAYAAGTADVVSVGDTTHNAAGTSAGAAKASANGARVLPASGTAAGAGQTSSTGSLVLSGGIGSAASSSPTVEVGAAYTDVAHQIVRTSGNRVYIVATNCDSYPCTSLTQTVRVFKADQTGIPSSFTMVDAANNPAAAGAVAIAVAANDDIHIVWHDRSSTGSVKYAVFDTANDTWGTVETPDADLSTPADSGQGDMLVSLSLDSNSVPHIVYLKDDGTRNRVNYRNRIGGTWSDATVVDDQTFGSNERCWHPSIAHDYEGRIAVVWLIGTFNDTADGTIYIRTRESNGTWNTTAAVSPSDDALTGIDQSASLLITADNRYHLAYMRASTTPSQKYIRYYYSDDDGATWTANAPGSGTQATHNPSLGPNASGGVRIWGHGTPNASNHGENIYYFDGAGGAGTWSAWTQFVTGTNYDSSVSTRWARYHFTNATYIDIAYWNDNYANVLYYGGDYLGQSNALSAGAAYATGTAEVIGVAGSIRDAVGTAAGAAYANASGALVLCESGTSAGAADTDSSAGLILTIGGTTAGAADTDASGALIVGAGGVSAGAALTGGTAERVGTTGVSGTSAGRASTSANASLISAGTGASVGKAETTASLAAVWLAGGIARGWAETNANASLYIRIGGGRGTITIVDAGGAVLTVIQSGGVIALVDVGGAESEIEL